MNTAPVVTGQALERKFMQALVLWKEYRPGEVAGFLREVRARRDGLRNEAGTSPEGDFVHRAMLPKWPVALLRQTAFATEMQYGLPCGLGDPLWDTNDQMVEAFLRCIPEANVSNQRGAPRRPD